MKRGAPMKRTAFKRKPPAPFVRPERVAAPPSRPAAWREAAPVDGQVRAVAKPVQHRNRRLLDLARGAPCLLRVPGVCSGDRETTVAAHSNWGVHGKGERRKADDHWTCWGCYACHTWLDQGQAPEVEKRRVFDAAHVRQVDAWRRMDADPKTGDADRAAVRWALGLLAANDPRFNPPKESP